MTVTIELSHEAERLLRERAELEGADERAVAALVLSRALESDAQDRAEAIAGIQRGLDDFAAGRSRRFEEFAAEQRSKYGLAAKG